MDISKLNLLKKLNSQTDKLKTIIAKVENKSNNLSTLRLLFFLIGIGLFIILFVLNFKTQAIISGISFLVVFIILVVIHNKIDLHLNKLKNILSIKKDFLNRINLKWQEIVPIKNEFVKKINAIESDLNILGENSLFQLINFCKTNEGFKNLRSWFSNTQVENQIIIQRQNIVKELLGLNRFRERLLLLTNMAFKKDIKKSGLTDWLSEAKQKKGLKLFSSFLILLSLINMTLILSWAFGITETFIYQPLLIYMMIYFTGNKYIRDIQKVNDFLFDEVRRYSQVFRFIESYNYKDKKNVKDFLSPIINSNISPSKSLDSLKYTDQILNFRRNPFIWFVVIAICPADYLIAMKLEKFKSTIKEHFPEWIKTWTTLEAYCSLANYAYLNPEYIFPEFTEEGSLVIGKDLGHPLIESNSKVVNDFELNEKNITNIITGSNMSGKSTFLRTLGVNILLAKAGSVVNARKLRIKNFELHTCIKVSDSVVDGISYFYSEVKRLKEILDLIKESKNESLVFIDEIYKGTNNIERLVGSRALIKHLSTNKINSIVTTHDLELVKIADELEDIKNYHFKESIRDNVMTFDYKLSDGPCPTTNALKIMNIEGLPT